MAMMRCLLLPSYAYRSAFLSAIVFMYLIKISGLVLNIVGYPDDSHNKFQSSNKMENVLANAYSITSAFLMQDHKRIAKNMTA